MTDLEQCLKWYNNANYKKRQVSISQTFSGYKYPEIWQKKKGDNFIQIGWYELIFNPEYKFFESMPDIIDMLPISVNEIKSECAGKTADEIFKYIVQNCTGGE